MRLFISYATIDVERLSLHALVRTLDDENSLDKVFFWERDCKGGQAIIEYMLSSIADSDALLVIDSETAKQSIPVNQEIAMALATKKRIIPVFQSAPPVRYIDVVKNLRGIFFDLSKLEESAKAQSEFRNNVYFLLTGKQREEELTSSRIIEMLEEANDRRINADIILKILVLGQGGTGKTTFLIREILDKFSPNTMLTAGIQFTTTAITYNGITICLQIWDCGGQERFRFLLETFMHETEGALLLYDVTRLQSLIEIEDWSNLVREKNPDIPILLVGNKKDLLQQCEYTIEEVSQIADDTVKKLNLIGHVVVSAKTGESVHDCFVILVRKIIELRDIKSLGITREPPVEPTALLNKFLAEIPEIQGAMLVTTNGTFVTSVGDVDKEKCSLIAAIARTARVILLELGKGGPEGVNIRSETGYSFIIDIGLPIVLALVTTKDAKIGLIMVDGNRFLSSLSSPGVD